MAASNWPASKISRKTLLQAGLFAAAFPLDVPHLLTLETSPIMQLPERLQDTSFIESPIGLNNWHLLDPSEGNIGNFSFAYNPLLPIPQDVVLFANTLHIMDFHNSTSDPSRNQFMRQDQLLAQETIERINEGCKANVVIEIDEDVSIGDMISPFIQFIHARVAGFTIGNEPDDPFAQWRNNMRRIYDAYKEGYTLLQALAYTQAKLYLPAMAYYGDGSDLDHMLHEIGNYAAADGFTPSSFIGPIADHFYGAVNDLLPRVNHMKKIKDKHDLSDHQYVLTEIGNPAPDTMHDTATATQIAEGYISQVLSLAIASKCVDSCTYYTLLDTGRPDHSLMRVVDGKLVAKPTYYTFTTVSKLLARLIDTNIVLDDTISVMYGKRWDNIEFLIVWSNVPDRNVSLPISKHDRVYNALGRALPQEEQMQTAILYPQQKPYLGGPARIILLGDKA